MAKMARLGTTGGDVPLAVVLTYPVRTVPGCHEKASADDPLLLINRTVYKWELILQDSTDVLLHLKYADAKEGGLFNDTPEMFLTQPVPLADYNKVADSFDAGKLKAWIKMNGWYYQLLREFLQMLPSTSSNESNFAAPQGPHKDGKAKPSELGLMELFKPPTGGKPNWKLSEQIFYIEADCDVLGSEVMRLPGTTAAGSALSGIKLAAQIRLDKIADPPESAWDSAVNRLVACDWTGLLEHSPAEKKLQPKEYIQRLDRWQRNVAVYFLNYTNLARGKRMFDNLVKDGVEAFKSGDRKAAVRALRDAIDQRLLTANAFAGVQESPKEEPYQAKLQRLFGSIKKHRVMAAPMLIFRILRNTSGLSVKEIAYFVLQAGVAHCGEHARLSFEVLKEMNNNLRKGTDRGPFEPLTLAAEADVDHAFVVSGLFAVTVIAVEVLRGNAHFDKNPAVDKSWFLWDFADALTGKDKGEICDPYLQKDFPSGSSMLKAIQRKGSKYLLLHDVETDLPPVLDPAPPSDAALKHLDIKNR